MINRRHICDIDWSVRRTEEGAKGGKDAARLFFLQFVLSITAQTKM